MKKSLRTKLSISYILLIFVCVILISFLANIFLQNQFNSYISDEHTRKTKSIVSSIDEEYSNGLWNKDMVENIGIDALENGMFITVEDSNNNIIWDANTYNQDECEMMIKRLTNNMLSRYPSWKGKLVKSKFDLTSDNNKVGLLVIQDFGPFYYNDNDVIYINTLNRILMVVGIASLLVALIIGLIMAKALSKPILKVIDAAETIGKGDYNKKIDNKSDIEEIDKLVSTINNLGKSLSDQESLRKRLTRDVSHELRTPLTILQSDLEAMLDGIWEPTAERLKGCHEESLRLSHLVEDLEDLYKYESENLVLNKTEFDLSEVINNIMLNSQKEFSDKGIVVKFVDKKIRLLADEDKISQAVENLLSNALQYTSKSGCVEIAINNDKEYVYIGVKDTGKGISKEDLPYIFERFYRADKSRNRLTGGAGIGLTITKSIVEAHKGSITVESKIDKGTDFCIKLPRVL